MATLRSFIASPASDRPDLSLDLVDFGAALLDWADQQVAQTITAVQASDLLIVASPTYKATYKALPRVVLRRARRLRADPVGIRLGKLLPWPGSSPQDRHDRCAP